MMIIIYNDVSNNDCAYNNYIHIYITLRGRSQNVTEYEYLLYTKNHNHIGRIFDIFDILKYYEMCDPKITVKSGKLLIARGFGGLPKSKVEELIILKMDGCNIKNINNQKHIKG